MPDLFTHLVAARVPGSFVRDKRLQALLVIGTFMPDIAFKGLYWIMQTRESFAAPSHSIVGVLIISYLACLFIDEALRRPAFIALAAGAMIHIAVDLIKFNLGAGACRPLLPFSSAGMELGWIDSENVVYLIPIDAAILAAAWFLERRFARVQQ